MEILSNIHWIEGINAHSYIVNGDHITIIDTGMPGNEGKILNYVKNVLNREPEDIKTIVITHYHLDHTGSLKELKNATNAKIAIHKDDADYISGKQIAPGPFYLRFATKLMLLFTSYRMLNPISYSMKKILWMVTGLYKPQDILPGVLPFTIHIMG